MQEWGWDDQPRGTSSHILQGITLFGFLVHGVTMSWTRLSDFTFTFHFHALEKEMATHSSVVSGESQGQGSLVGCRLWGRTESDTTEAT